jgi:hypothetical protein
MQHLDGSGTPVLYIGRTVLKGENKAWVSSEFCCCLYYVSHQLQFRSES